MLSSGLVHGELTTLLWGGAFTFVWLYAMVARALAGRAPGVRWPQGSLIVDSGNQLVFVTEAKPTAPAFFAWWLRVEGLHSSARRFEVRIPLEAGRKPLVLSPPRGHYQVTARWELTDAFGFTRLIPRARWTAVLVVEPVPLPFSPPRPPATRPGPWRPQRSGRQAGDPFDVRQYAPGDDLRRLHWPLLAHAAQLFVRTAEPSPPPSGHQFLILDTEASSEEDLDERLGRLVTWLAQLQAQGTGWTVVIPAIQKTLRPEAAAGPILAALTPAPLPDEPVPAGWPASVTVLTGPRSQGTARLSQRLISARRRFQSVETPLAQREPSAKRPWWRRS